MRTHFARSERSLAAIQGLQRWLLFQRGKLQAPAGTADSQPSAIVPIVASGTCPIRPP
ncbi:Hypothetical predicted protein, partial [Marmota monax]